MADPWRQALPDLDPSSYGHDFGEWGMDVERHGSHGFDDIEKPHRRPWGDKPFRLSCDCGRQMVGWSPESVKEQALLHLAGKL